MDLSSLNLQQRQAVETIDRPLLILAGAGSGKTNVLVHRIAYLIDKGVSPYSILAITFTNKAAREMKTRIQDLIGPNANQVRARTFHSTCLQILRINTEEAGLKNNFVIYDSGDQLSICKHLLHDMNIDADVLSPRSLLSQISNLKNLHDNFEDVLKDLDSQDLPQVVYDAAKAYQETLISNNAIDFDDILTYTVRLLKTHQDILDYYRNRFRYILVDEYQDTNQIQYDLIRLLSGPHNNICVVGDDDQSIYEWRGANVRNILNFENDHPDAVVIKLEKNYRSTKNILKLSNSVIAHNDMRKPKKMWTDNAEGQPAIYYEASDDRDEGSFIARQIKDLRTKASYNYSDFAILIRTASQFRSLEETLLMNRIPYRIFGGIKFFSRREIKDILAYLSIVSNPNDALNLQRVINIPKRGIGEKTLEKITSYHSLHPEESLLNCLIAPDLKLSSKTKSAVHSFHDLIVEAQELSRQGSIAELINFILDGSNYRQYIAENTSSSPEISADYIDEFYSMAQEFDNRELPLEQRTLASFLEEIALYTDLDQSSDGTDAVNLMTMHSSKGLEFPVVFVAGFEENLFPHARSLADDADHGLEEERRLCYVSFTRAKDYLYITRAKKRLLHGRFCYNGVSAFYYEMDTEAFVNVSDKGYWRNSLSQGLSKPPKPKMPSPSWKPGDHLIHGSWGEGVVVKVDKDDNNKITVAFPNQGIKILSVDFAPITKV